MDWLDRIHIYFVGSGVRSSPDNLVYHYQTLISGFLAVAAAGFTVWVLLHQVWVMQRQHEELINRQYRAARSSLSLALMDISDYAEQCVNLLSQVLSKHDEEDDIRDEVDAPPMPASALSSLSQLIALADEQDARKLQSLLIHLQIQRSRLVSRLLDISPTRSPNSSWVKQDLRHDVLDAFILMRMTNIMFAYARWEVDHLPEVSEESISGSYEYILGSKFDKLTEEYVAEKLPRFTVRAFEDRKEKRSSNA